MKIIILRGPSLSGKSTFTKEFNEETTAVCSADFFFEERAKLAGTTYERAFNPAMLGTAHGTCLANFVELVTVDECAYDTVIVDNTNCSAVEVAPYLALAQAYEHEVEIVQFECPLEVLLERSNGHGCPQHAIEGQYRALHEEKLPPWWPEARVITTG
jgi:predicted kinase